MGCSRWPARGRRRVPFGEPRTSSVAGGGDRCRDLATAAPVARASSSAVWRAGGSHRLIGRVTADIDAVIGLGTRCHASLPRVEPERPTNKGETTSRPRTRTSRTTKARSSERSRLLASPSLDALDKVSSCPTPPADAGTVGPVSGPVCPISGRERPAGAVSARRNPGTAPTWWRSGGRGRIAVWSGRAAGVPRFVLPVDSCPDRAPGTGLSRRDAGFQPDLVVCAVSSTARTGVLASFGGRTLNPSRVVAGLQGLHGPGRTRVRSQDHRRYGVPGDAGIDTGVIVDQVAVPVEDTDRSRSARAPQGRGAQTAGRVVHRLLRVGRVLDRKLQWDSAGNSRGAGMSDRRH